MFSASMQQNLFNRYTYSITYKKKLNGQNISKSFKQTPQKECGLTMSASALLWGEESTPEERAQASLNNFATFMSSTEE